MSDESVRPRVRINAKSTSKGEYYFEATAESDDVDRSAGLLIDAVIKAQAKFKEVGKNIVKDVG